MKNVSKNVQLVHKFMFFLWPLKKCRTNIYLLCTVQFSKKINTNVLIWGDQIWWCWVVGGGGGGSGGGGVCVFVCVSLPLQNLDTKRDWHKPSSNRDVV